MVKCELKKHKFLKTYESINIINSVEVQGVGRRLRATWSPQLVQDLSAYHSIDAEAELTALLTENIAQEIDREIMGDLMNLQNDHANYIRGRSFTPQQQLEPHRFTHLPRRLQGDFENVAFPLVRRVFTQTLGLDLVAVQPMGPPIGQLMYLDFNNNINDSIIQPTVLPNGSWYLGNRFDSHIGVKMTLKPHTLFKKEFNIIDTAPFYFTR